MTLDLLIENDR